MSLASANSEAWMESKPSIKYGLWLKSMGYHELT